MVGQEKDQEVLTAQLYQQIGQPRWNGIFWFIVEFTIFRSYRNSRASRLAQGSADRQFQFLGRPVLEKFVLASSVLWNLDGPPTDPIFTFTFIQDPEGIPKWDDEARKGIGAYLAFYNQERPHWAIGHRVNASPLS